MIHPPFCRNITDMLLEKIVYVFEIVSIFGRTTGDVHAEVNCYAPTVIWTYNTPFFYFFTNYCELILEEVSQCLVANTPVQSAYGQISYLTNAFAFESHIFSNFSHRFFRDTYTIEFCDDFFLSWQ